MPPATAADYDLLEMSDPTDSNDPASEAAEEEITFSVLRRDSEEPIGPLSAEQILEMLKNDELSRQDFVFYEGMEDWMSIDSVFEIQEQISHFVDDGQIDGFVKGILRGFISRLLNPFPGRILTHSLLFFGCQRRTQGKSQTENGNQHSPAGCTLQTPLSLFMFIHPILYLFFTGFCRS